MECVSSLLGVNQFKGHPAIQQKPASQVSHRLIDKNDFETDMMQLYCDIALRCFSNERLKTPSDQSGMLLAHLSGVRRCYLNNQTLALALGMTQNHRT